MIKAIRGSVLRRDLRGSQTTQRLINAPTGKVGPRTKMSGYPTNQDLVELVQCAGPRPLENEREDWDPLVEEVHVHDDQSDVGSDAEGEAAKMQSRMNSTAVTDAGHQESGIGQDGESEPSSDENLAEETA